MYSPHNERSQSTLVIQVAHAIGAGPPVSLVCLSPDWRLLAMQRSPSHVEVLDTSTGNIIVQVCTSLQEVCH